MKFSSLALFTTLISTAVAIVPPGADTPLFYLVASSKNGGSGNLAVSSSTRSLFPLKNNSYNVTPDDPHPSIHYLTPRPHA
jgi:hypothetical protein